MINFKLIITILLFLTLNINLICSLNIKNVDYYHIKRYENIDCTGDVMSFFTFYESLIFSSYLSIQFLCDNSNSSNISCQMVNGYPDGQLLSSTEYNEEPIKISSNECSRGYSLTYNKDFDYDEKKYCVISEYSTLSCEYRPILSFGNVKNVCFKGRYYECSTLSFSERTCGVIQNKTIYDDTVVEISSYVCLGDSKYERAVVVHAITIKGNMDKNVKGIYAPNLRPQDPGRSNEYYYNNSSKLLSSISSILIILLLVLLQLLQ